MSGFAAIAAEDRTTATRLAGEPIFETLRWRGPDASTDWVGDRALLVHSQFRTTRQAARERQPIVSGDRYAVAGDVRLDDRESLCDALAVPADAAAEIPDIDLVVKAWRRWGRDCVQHLLGDFAFVVWDIEARRLFAARDHFGVRPLYYATSNRHIVVSNMIAAVRRHPAVSDDLDEQAVMDWLVFEYFERPDSTPFSDVRRLPGGHTLEWQAGTCTVRRYWEGPGAIPVRYKRDEEYVERYRELLDRAVADRVRSESVSVAMTGGLDSSSIAAAAVHALGTTAVHAGTIVYDNLIRDEERRFAGLVAGALGVRHTFLAADDRPIYDRLADTTLMPPEPVDDPFRAMLTDFYRGLAGESRVVDGPRRRHIPQ
jgi:asparagine synthase (glutamine-hydrolysing)